jgi:hypothetical protein
MLLSHLHPNGLSRLRNGSKKVSYSTTSRLAKRDKFVEDADFFVQTRAGLEMISTNRRHPDEFTSVRMSQQTEALCKFLSGINQFHAGNLTSQ